MFDTPTFEDIRSAILRDTLSLDPSADVSADSDHYVHASRLASCAVGQYAHQHWIVRQMFPDTADAAYLERHAGLRGLRRRSGHFCNTHSNTANPFSFCAALPRPLLARRLLTPFFLPLRLRACSDFLA